MARMARRTLSSLILSSLLAAACGGAAPSTESPQPAAPAAEAPATYKVTSVVLAPVSTMSGDDAKAAIGQELVRGPDGLRFRDNVCKEPAATRRTEPAEAYLAGFKVAPPQLGLVEPQAQLQVVSTKCEGELKEYIEAGDVVWLFWDGVFYKLERAAQ